MKRAFFEDSSCVVTSRVVTSLLVSKGLLAVLRAQLWKAVLPSPSPTVSQRRPSSPCLCKRPRVVIGGGGTEALGAGSAVPFQLEISSKACWAALCLLHRPRPWGACPCEHLAGERAPVAASKGADIMGLKQDRGHLPGSSQKTSGLSKRKQSNSMQ